MEEWLHGLEPSTRFHNDGASELPARLLSEEEASMDPCRGYWEEWLELDSDRAYNLGSYTKRLTGLVWVCLE